MSDWQDILTGVLLFVACMVFSLVTVNLLSSIVLFVAFLILTYFFLSLAGTIISKGPEIGIEAILIRKPIIILVVVVLSMIVSAIIVLTLTDIIKLVATVALAWVLFRFALRFVSERLSGELDEFLHRIE